ncbi:hypothetical protein Y032_0029g2010 [Ancylostoma ceylanicum]|nr:hypothetical protein Y032_0029g2010 [Ancylostoma ceylanicum]
MFALLFYNQSRAKDVVPTSALPAGAECGDVARVRHDGCQFETKGHWNMYSPLTLATLFAVLVLAYLSAAQNSDPYS